MYNKNHTFKKILGFHKAADVPIFPTLKALTLSLPFNIHLLYNDLSGHIA
jgi:hypothetical protein